MVRLYDFRFQRRSIYLFELALCFFEFARFVIFLEIDQPSLQKDLHHQTFRLQLVRFMMVGWKYLLLTSQTELLIAQVAGMVPT